MSKLKMNYHAKTVIVSNVQLGGQSSKHTKFSFKLTKFEFFAQEAGDSKRIVESYKKQLPMIETGQLTKLLKKLIVKREKFALSKLNQNRKNIRFLKAASLMRSKFNRQLLKFLKDMNKEAILKEKCKKMLRFIARRNFINNCIKGAQKYHNSYFAMMLSMRSLSIIKSIRLNQVKVIVRKWKLFIDVKRSTFSKYQSIYNEMWNIYSQEVYNNQNKSDIANKEAIFEQIMNLHDPNKVSLKSNQLKEKYKSKKDYLSIKILSDFEEFIDKVDDTPTNITSVFK